MAMEQFNGFWYCRSGRSCSRIGGGINLNHGQEKAAGQTLAKKRKLSKSKNKALKSELGKSGGRGRATRRLSGARRTQQDKRVRDTTLTDRFHAVDGEQDEEMFEEQGERIQSKAPARKEARLRKTIFEQAHELEAQGERPENWLQGIVIQLVPGGCAVDVDGQLMRCFLRGALKELRTGASKPVVVGDRVWIEPQPDGASAVEAVEPRRTKLSRPTSRRRTLETIVVANVDLLVIVASVQEPEFKQGLVDRYLVAAERGGMDAVVCVNKADLADEEHPLPQIDFYDALGYKTLFVSALNEAGIDELRKLLAGRTSVLAGHSGTGKSSLINAVQPGMKLEVGDISQSTMKGRHTTVTVKLLPLDVGGYVADTPGIRAFGLWDLHREELEMYFPEIAALTQQCQMSDCSHTHEPGCAVKEAVEAGEIAIQRYDSYVSIYESLPSSSPWEKQK